MLYAVIVGIDKYRDSSIPNLQFAAADAVELAHLCKESHYAADIDVQLITNGDATRGHILHTLGTEVARRATARDVILVYFACHGSPETIKGITSASRFLACHDTFKHDLFSSGIDIGVDLIRVVERFRSRLTVFVLDACFSGFSGGRGFAGPVFETYRKERRAGS